MKENFAIRAWEAIMQKEAEPHDHPLLFITGPQSVGKSTLCGILQGRGVLVYEEPWRPMESQLGVLNKLKAKIFAGQASQEEEEQASQLALEIEIGFLREQEQITEELRPQLKTRMVAVDGGAVTDASYGLVYAVIGLLKSKHLPEYLAVLEETLEKILRPDLIAGLLVSGKKLIERWQPRADISRGFEKVIPTEYLTQMAEINNNLVQFGLNKGWPILPIDTDRLDFANNGAHKEEVVAMIREALKGRFPRVTEYL